SLQATLLGLGTQFLDPDVAGVLLLALPLVVLVVFLVVVFVLVLVGLVLVVVGVVVVSVVRLGHHGGAPEEGVVESDEALGVACCQERLLPVSDGRVGQVAANCGFCEAQPHLRDLPVVGLLVERK